MTSQTRLRQIAQKKLIRELLAYLQSARDWFAATEARAFPHSGWKTELLTLEKILSDPRVKKYLKRKQKDF